jgi:anhydro-N-acetylmuramic acid kinase
MKPIVALGAMSGTSMDGIDLSLLRTDGEERIEIGPNGFYPYEAGFRHEIEAALEDAKAIRRRQERPGDLARVEREITLRHAEAIRDFLAGQPDEWARPEVVGFHGQTVLHRPQDALTVQLGDGQLLADELGLPVVFDMRANDMAHGGQGAPLVPAYHAALAANLPEPRRHPVAFVNIGGISNITFVPEAGDPIAFDTGPGNALIDQWMQREGGIPYDAGGAVASEGEALQPIVDRYLASPFFARGGPKSLDRGDFTLDPVQGLELADGARTLAALSAQAILESVAHLPGRPELWIVCGGGRKNRVIMDDLRSLAAPAEVVSAEEVGLAGDATEAEAWAFLAVRALRGLPLSFPATTGCREPVTGGVLVRPK